MRTTTSATPARPAPEPDISTLLSDLAASGKSTAAFARERGIPPWKLYNALRARSGKARRARAAARRENLLPVRVVEEVSPSQPLELVLGGDLRLRIPADFDEAVLRRLIGVLGRC